MGPRNPIGAGQFVLDESGIGRQFSIHNLRNDSIYNLFDQGGLGLDGGHAISRGLFLHDTVAQKNLLLCIRIQNMYSVFETQRQCGDQGGRRAHG